MNTTELDHATKHVDYLLEQYQQYLSISNGIDKLKTKQMQLAIKFGTELGQPFTDVLQNPPTELQAIADDIKTAEQDLQRVSDEMTFATPIAWMMYKYKAYLGTSQAITDMQDFRKHCSKPDYICTKRYLFLNTYLKHLGTDLNNMRLFPNEMRLPDVYARPELLALPSDKAFMTEWDIYEYHTDGGRVAKWENYRN